MGTSLMPASMHACCSSCPCCQPLLHVRHAALVCSSSPQLVHVAAFCKKVEYMSQRYDPKALIYVNEKDEPYRLRLKPEKLLTAACVTERCCAADCC